MTSLKQLEEEEGVALSSEEAAPTIPSTEQTQSPSAPLRTDSSSLSPPSSNEPTKRSSSILLGLRQIFALIHKNFLIRYRTPLATFMEVFSPVLMMLVLVAAYQLSQVTYKSAALYDTIRLSVPGPWLDLLQHGLELNNITTASRRLRPSEEFDSAQETWTDQVLPPALQRRLQVTASNDDTVVDDDAQPIGNTSDIYDLLNAAQKDISKFLRNPLLVPNFTEYVILSEALSSLINAQSLPKLFQDSSYGQKWGNLLTLGTLHVAPSTTNHSQNFVKFLSNVYPTRIRIRLHNTSQDALEYIDNNLAERTWALVDLTRWESNTPIYEIRLNYTTIPNTNEITNFVTIGLDRAYQQYYLSGFLTLQRTLNEFVWNQTNSCADDFLPNLWSMPMPTAAYSQNSFFLQVGYLLGLTIVMAYLYPTSRLIKMIVEEKEIKMKEVMLILGLRTWAHWWSWTLTSLIMFSIISVLVTRVLAANILRHSDPSYLFAWIFFFGTSTMGFCNCIAALFSRAKLASIIGPMALFATILPRFIFFGYNRYEAATAKKWASILPATAFAFGADIVADYEYAEQGIQPWNANEGDYSFVTSLGFLVFDTFLYILLGWYLDQIVPRQYGAPRQLWFLLSPMYWLGCILPAKTKTVAEVNVIEYENSGDHQIIEDPSLLGKVEIRNLSKRFTTEKSVPPAVDRLNLKIYENQITTLLGSNGAGKSTTVGILTGLILPTSGDCFVYGHSIVENPNDARQSIGLCPQGNVIFERLTVLEHIRFFSKIKGKALSREESKDRAHDIGLDEFFHTTGSALSGGNKRKLSVAIALCGDPKLLVLDEPTSGMDPNARRSTWELLRRGRIGRTTLLISHFMDEAELLSDRVVIMRAGAIQCSGSPLFLKQRFGLGYDLTVVLSKPNGVNEPIDDNESGGRPEDISSHGLEEAAPKVENFLKGYIPGTRVSRIGGKEITFRIPQGSEESFGECFDELERQRRSLDVGTFGVENASLEEIFITLAEREDNTEEEDHIPSRPEPVDTIEVTHSDRESISAIRQIGLLFRKRVTVQRRDFKGTFFTVIVPVLLIALVLLVLTIKIPLVGPAISMSPNLYGNTTMEIPVAVGSVDANYSEESFEHLASRLRATYPQIDFQNLRSNHSSSDLSVFLLDTININRLPRYSAFALNDTIPVEIFVDYDALRGDVQSLLNTAIIVDSFLTNQGAILNGTNVSNPITSADLQALVSSSAIAEIFLPSGTTTYKTNIQSFASILHNASSPHAVAAFNQAFTEYLYKTCTANASARIMSINHPLPLTTDQNIEIKTILSVLASMFILIPFCYIPGAFIVFLVKEKTCKSKHLQLVSGVDMTSYWISSYIFDVFLYFILTIMTMLVFLMYGKDAAQVFVGDFESFLCTMALIFGYGLSILPFSYLFSRRFDNHSSAQIAVIGVVFITGFVAVNAYFIMDSIDSTKNIASAIRPLFRTWPAYNVGDGFIQLAIAFWEREILDEDRRPFDWAVAGKSITLLYGLIFPYFILLLMLEYASDGGAGGAFGRMLRSIRNLRESLSLKWYGLTREGEANAPSHPREDMVEDDDVREEALYVTRNLDDLKQRAPVLYHKLWKIYPPSTGSLGAIVSLLGRFFSNIICLGFGRKAAVDEDFGHRPKCAVRGVTTAIYEGETYCLLGPNGAGKSSTLGVISGDVHPTSGTVYVAGHDVTGKERDGVTLARKHIGFCPQIDPLIDLMTPRETLRMFGLLRGIPQDMVDDTVRSLLDRLTLTAHADKTSESLSGGNKRKLSLGIALVGDPKVILIDESSSGLDPGAKRKIWSLIYDISKDRSTLLTTHSLEEAEALCTRAGIMANGKLLCVGTVQHLKSKYLDGYTIDIFFPADKSEGDIDDAMQEIVGSLSGSTVLERHGRFVRLDLPDISSLGIGTTFRRLEEMKKEGCFESYSLAQCSLEQVFLKLTNAS